MVFQKFLQACVFLVRFSNWLHRVGWGTWLVSSRISCKLGSSQIRGGSSSLGCAKQSQVIRGPQSVSGASGARVIWPKLKHFDGPNILMAKTRELWARWRWAFKDAQNATPGNIQIHLTRTAYRFLILFHICHTTFQSDFLNGESHAKVWTRQHLISLHILGMSWKFSI